MVSRSRRQPPAGNTPSGPSPYKPPSADGSTSNVVEASGAANHGESVSTKRNGTVNRNALGRPLPTRNWEQNYINNYGGYGGFRGPYGGGLYGNNMYRGPPYTGYGMYGTGMYNNGYGGPVGGYHGIGMGGQNGDQDPNNLSDLPSPPGFWMSFLGVVRGAVMFLGRISILIDKNTQAFHMFMSALLQVFDTSGILYGELASFVFRLLGIMPMLNKARQLQPGAPSGTNLRSQNNIKWPKTASNSWDYIWGDGCTREK